jgi:hypothetical protein
MTLSLQHCSLSPRDRAGINFWITSLCENVCRDISSRRLEIRTPTVPSLNRIPLPIGISALDYNELFRRRHVLVYE